MERLLMNKRYNSNGMLTLSAYAGVAEIGMDLIKYALGESTACCIPIDRRAAGQ